jgi:thymidylate kinase
MAETDSPEAKLLNKLFHDLNDSGLSYAVMRNYELLPRSADGSDLDILIDPKQEQLIMDCISTSIRSADGVSIGQVDTAGLSKIFAFGQPDHKDDQWWGLRLDICKGVVYRGSHNLIKKTVYTEHVKKHHGIKVLSSDLAAVIGVMKEVLHNGRIGDRYINEASDAASERWHSISKVLSPIGEDGLNRLYKICSRDSSEISLTSEAKHMRRYIETRSFLACPVSYVLKKIQYYGSKIMRVIHPPGKMIVFLGTDGAGKSTIIEAIKPALMDATHKSVLIKHLRPRLLPPIGRIKGTRDNQNETVTDPHGASSSGTLLSLVRLAYYYLDYTIGYWLLVRPIISKSPSVVIFDRYAYDILLDPKRLRINLPQWILRLFVSIVPKPDLTVCLYGNAEVIAARKNELSVDEVKRQVDALVSFAGNVKSRLLVNTESSVVETRNCILYSIKNACLKLRE